MYTGATANVYKLPYEQHVPCVTQFLLQCWPKPKNEIEYLGPNESLIAKVYLSTEKKYPETVQINMYEKTWLSLEARTDGIYLIEPEKKPKRLVKCTKYVYLVLKNSHKDNYLDNDKSASSVKSLSDISDADSSVIVNSETFQIDFSNQEATIQNSMSFTVEMVQDGETVGEEIQQYASIDNYSSPSQSVFLLITRVYRVK